MKIVLGIVALLIIAASILADYKWRQWMAARRREHENQGRFPDGNGP